MSFLKIDKVLEKPQGVFDFKVRPGFTQRFLYRLATFILITSLQESASWPKSRLYKLKSKKFRKLLLRANSHSSFWNAYFKSNKVSVENIYSIDSLGTLPFSDKNLLIKQGEESLLTQALNSNGLEVVEKTTSGTSGKIIQTFFNRNMWYVSGSAYYFRSLPESTISIFNLLNPQITPICLLNMLRHQWSAEFYCFEVFLDDLQEESKQKELLAYIRLNNPKILMTYPSSLALLVSTLQKHSLSINDIFPSLKLIILAGETFSSAERTKLEQVFECKIMQMYAMREVAWIGWECVDNRGYYHLHEERLLLEVVDDNGNQVADGEYGEIVLTCLDNLLMPLIRYKTGDRGKILTKKCLCGSSHTLFEVSGRTSDVVRFKDGTSFQVLRLTRFFYGNGLGGKVAQYHIAQNALNKLEVYIVPNDIFSNSDTLSLKKQMELLFKNKLSVDINIVKSIPINKSGKQQIFSPMK